MPTRFRASERREDKKSAEKIFSQLFSSERNENVAIIADSGDWHRLTKIFNDAFDTRYKYVAGALQAADKNCDSYILFANAMMAAIEHSLYPGQPNSFSVGIAKVDFLKIRNQKSTEKDKETAASQLAKYLAVSLAEVLALGTFGLTTAYALGLGSKAPQFQNRAGGVEIVVRSLSEGLKSLGFSVKPLHQRMYTLLARFQFRFNEFKRFLKKNSQYQQNHYLINLEIETPSSSLLYEAFLKKLANYSE